MRAFAEELEAGVPQIVAAVHVAGIRVGEFLWVGAGSRLFHHHIGRSLVARLEQPGVVGKPLVCLSVPGDASRGLELVDGAVNVRAKGDPVERDAGAEGSAGVVDRDVARVGVPVRPSGGVNEMLPDLPAGAAITMSLWAKRSACSGTMPSGQWMCAERCWMSSMIDMRCALHGDHAQSVFANTHMECGLSNAHGRVARGLRG